MTEKGGGRKRRDQGDTTANTKWRFRTMMLKYTAMKRWISAPLPRRSRRRGRFKVSWFHPDSHSNANDDRCPSSGQYIQNHHEIRRARSKPSSTTSRSTRSAPENGTRTGTRKGFQERGDFPPGVPSSGTFPKKSHLYPTSAPYSAPPPSAVLPPGPPPQPGMGPPPQQSMRPAGIPQQGPDFFN